MLKKYFVTFFSPGTFTSEMTVLPIESYDINKAMEMAREITERHGSTPYGFRFETRSREDNELDSKVTATSNMYFLGGKVETLEEVEARNDPDEEIMRSNMRNLGIDRIIINTNSWKTHQPFREGDIVLEFPQ